MSATLPRLSVIVPAFNEAGRISGAIEELQRHLPAMASSWEIRIVDDGSADDTRGLVARAAEADPRVVLQSEPHRGKGGAVRAGMLAAPGELRFICDADLSMPLGELPRFLALVPDECDVAIGSREGGGARRVGEPAARHWMGRVFNALVRAGGLTHTQDTQCGFKLFTAAAAGAVFPRVTIEGWAFDIEVLWLAEHLGFRIRELPIEWHYRTLSRVSPLGDSLRMARDVWRIRRNAAAGKYER